MGRKPHYLLKRENNLPKNKIIKKDDLDRFYTNPKIAKECINICVSIVGNNRLFVEPSAGSGSFYLQLPENKIGIDISPACDGVIEHDWLTFDTPENCVIIGNPPFGSRNTLTNKFIEHSIKKCSVVAFILPSVYRKESMQKVFPKEWHLIHDHLLQDNSFILDNEEYHVPCVFQIWEKNSTLPNLRESIKLKKTTNDFLFTTKENANYFIFGAAPQKVVDKEVVNSNNRGYWINCDSEVKTKISQINWKQYGLSSVNGGVSWFSKQQIIDIYQKEYYG